MMVLVYIVLGPHLERKKKREDPTSGLRSLSQTWAMTPVTPTFLLQSFGPSVLRSFGPSVLRSFGPSAFGPSVGGWCLHVVKMPVKKFFVSSGCPDVPCLAATFSDQSHRCGEQHVGFLQVCTQGCQRLLRLHYAP